MRDIILKIQRINELIERKSTGTPAQLARRIGSSERTVFEYLKLMRSFDAPIFYSRNLQTYYYKKAGMFAISFIEDEEPLIPEVNNSAK